MSKLTPIKAIRKKCLECCCGQRNEVRLCHIKDCALWGYRMGHRPKDDADTSETDASMEDFDDEVVHESIQHQKTQNYAPRTVVNDKEGGVAR